MFEGWGASVRRGSKQVEFRARSELARFNNMGVCFQTLRVWRGTTRVDTWSMWSGFGLTGGSRTRLNIGVVSPRRSSGVGSDSMSSSLKSVV